jgi:glycosyltransferase involved in cell wall biosynthesis
MTKKGEMLQGGAGQCVLQLVKGLVKKKIDVSIVTRAEKGEYSEILDIPVHRAKYIDLGFRESKATGMPMMLLKSFEPKNIDIIHSHNPPGAMSAYPLALKRNLPHMMTLHGPWADVRGKYQLIANPIEKISIGMADKVTLDSEALKKRMIEKHKLKKDAISKLVTIPNAIEIDIFKPRDRNKARTHLNLPKDRKIISYTGRFVEGKRVQDILQAVPKVVSENRDALFLFVGGGHDQRLINDWINKNEKFKHNIQIISFLEYSAMPGLYNASDIFVLPTLAEGLSRSLLEAMSSAVPVIATDIEANSEIVKEGTGILVPVKSPGDISDGINTILTDNKLSKKMSMKGRQNILKHFSVEQRVNSFIKEYKSMI